MKTTLLILMAVAVVMVGCVSTDYDRNGLRSDGSIIGKQLTEPIRD